MLLLLFFITHIDTPLKTITTNSFTVGVTIETTKNNVNILDGVHIIFLYLIVTVLRKITSNSCMVGITIEEEKNNVNNLDCVHIIF